MVTTRLAVVDDHAMFLDLLSRRLAREDDLEVVLTAGTAAQALAGMSPDVDIVLLDYHLPDADGTDLVDRIRDIAPDAQTIILTTVEDPEVLLEAIAVGCAGFVSKTSPLDDVLAAVRTVAAGESAIAPAALFEVLSRSRGAGPARPSPLTDRETEVLEQMALARTNREIATALYLSVDTVRNHVASLLRKLDSHSKLEAVVTAARSGLIDLAPRED